MKAIVKAEAGPGFEIKDVPVPEIGPRDVLVKIKAASICGTDVHIYNWDEWSQKRIKPPIVMGHEFCGEVVKVGKDVALLKEGDYITSDSHVVCGTCLQCVTGKSHICENTKILGVDIDGVFAEYAKIPESSAWKTSKKVPPEIASVQEPFGNAVHATLKDQVSTKSVAIFGLGPIGLFSAAIAKHCGASIVMASDINPYRIELGKKIGIDVVMNDKEEDVVKTIKDKTFGRGADVVLEMSGNPKAINDAFESLRLGGRMCLFGIPPGDIKLDINKHIIFKGAKIYGIIGREMFQTWFKTTGLLRGGIDVAPIVTHKINMEDFEKGIELMKKGECGKVVMYPGGV